MAKLRLVVWTVATGVLTPVLLRGLGWSEEPAIQLMTLVRGVAGLLAAYLFLATVLAIRLPRLAPAFVVRLVAGAVGTGLLVTPMTASADPRPRPPTEAPVLHRIAPEPTPPERSEPLIVRAATQGGGEVVVAPGDHLWSIAERGLAARLGRPPTDDEITPYWLELIELNRSDLVDPDLIFAGQVLRLPS